MGRVTDTISGSLATFRTPGKQLIRSLKAYFTPKQEGEGTPSPDNIRPITGWTGVEVQRTGKNQIDESYLADADSYPNLGSYGYYYTNDIHLKPNTRYRFVWYDYDNTALSELEAGSINLYLSGASEYIINNADYRQYSSGFITPSTGIIRFGIYHPSRLQRQDVLDAIFNNGKLLLQIGTSDEDYEPYNGITLPIDWSSAGTVYGGYVDLVTGEVWETWRRITCDELTTITAPTTTSTPWNHIFTIGLWNSTTGTWDKARGSSNIISDVAQTANSNVDLSVFGISNSSGMYLRDDSISTRDEFLAKYGNKHLAYELATPTLVTTLTPTALRTLIGTNNIWCNSGDVSVEYDFAESMEMQEARKRGMAFDAACKKYRVPPVGYRFIEYAENRYNGYVQLPYGFDPTDTIEIKGSIDASQGGEHWLVGSWIPWNDNVNRFSMLGVSFNNFCCTFGSQGSPNNLLAPVHAVDGDVHIATYANRTFQMTDLGTTMDVSGFTFGRTSSALTLFRGYQYCQGKIYYYKQTKADGTKLFVRPIQNKTTGVVEMYDTISKTIIPRTNTLYAPEE